MVGTPTAPELTNQGYIGVYLSDPEADVTFSVSPTDRHEGQELPGYRALRIDLTVKSREDPLWWAVALGGSARIPPNLLWAMRQESNHLMRSARTM